MENFHEGVGSFSVRVSSEPGFDTLGFYMNGVRKSHWSGEVAWTKVTFSVPVGTNTLEWRYSKDPSRSREGLDAAFLDDVDLPLLVATNAMSPARLEISRLLNGSVQLRVAGQTNQTYVIEGADELNRWKSISTNVAGSGIIKFMETLPTSARNKFYRAVVR